MIKSNFQDLRRKKALDEKRDISLRTVAKEADLSLGTVQKISGEELEGLRLSTIEKLCSYFNVGLCDLIEIKPK